MSEPSMERQAAIIAGLRAALTDLSAGALDMLRGWREIRQKGGEQSVYGIGWDRAQQHVEKAEAAARAALERTQ